ncbi:spherulation-specific family 4 protein [Streptomyces sp. ODS28]|uniref:spherulation-specific family 4 protein n=1 Tax=Streptomyces sp. ODS28 TaxID=3136688 RepID=UPI0031EBF5B9
MPHLTRPGDPRQRPGSAVRRLGMGAPGCAHPMLAPGEWGELARPGVPLDWAVLDIAGGGPGSRPDPYWLQAAAALHEAGTGVLGCLDMWDGTRTFGELISDAHRHLDWYRVDGFYLDRCPGDLGRITETNRVASTLRALSAEGHIVLGHGAHPDPAYAEVGDQLVTFNGSWSEYRWAQVEEWTADHPPWRFCHLVHGLPGTHLDEALRLARWQGAGTVWFTDRTARSDQSPWEILPGYWDDLVSRLGPGVSE